MTADLLTHWDRRFIGLARHVAGWSKDPSTKVGAVIASPENVVVSIGFNGFPRGVADDARLDGRESKYPIIVHAERNAILFAGHGARGGTLYVWPLAPCAPCAGMIIQAGIGRVVAPAPAADRWAVDCARAASILTEAGVAVVEHSAHETEV